MKTSLVESRAPYWRQATESFKKHPLLGTGLGTFYLDSKLFQQEPKFTSWFAHSFPLEILVELGIVGFFLVFFILYGLLSSAPGSPLFHGVMLTIVYSLYETNLNFLVIWLLLWASIGILSSSVAHRQLFSTKHIQYVFLTILALYYLSFTVSWILPLVSRDPFYPFIVAQYDSVGAIRFVGNATKSSVRFDTWLLWVVFFHKKNSEVLIEIARYEKLVGARDVSTFYRQAIELDPQNNTYVEEYVSFLLEKKEPKNLLWVVAFLTSFISQDKNRDEAFLYRRWDQIYPCFNKDAFLWTEGQLHNTYQAKTLYFAGLCLVKHGQYDDARELLRMASDARTSWSNIYLDYAG